MFASIHSTAPASGQTLLDLAYTFSPLVEETLPDTVVIDVGGCDRLFGPPRGIGERILRKASQMGLDVDVALAQNPDAAIHGARGHSGLTIIPPGKELICLGDLPLNALLPVLAGIEEARALELLETLDLWGIRCFRDLAGLPETGLSERLGPEGVRLQRLAGGKSRRSLVLIKPAPGFEQSVELDDPIELLEPLSFILARLINQLCGSLSARGLATNELRVRMTLEDRSLHERTISLPFPMRDHRVFLKLLQLDVESDPPQRPVIAVTVTAEPVKPRVLQNGLFIPLAPEPAKLELTVARIAKLVGPENVGSAELLDTNRPGAFRIKRFGESKRSNGARHQKSMEEPECLMGLRVFRPPLPARVDTPGGRPSRVVSLASNEHRDRKCARRKVSGKVVWAAGPWRTSGDWWTLNRWARDEWDVAVESEALYRIYRDLQSGSWFIEGVYD